MTKLNAPALDRRIDREAPRLAGGYGPQPAAQSAEAHLARVVLSCLLGEDLAYIDGLSVTRQIADLVPQVAPEAVARLAVQARLEQGLRHVPLFLAYQMTKHATHRPYVEGVLATVCTRPDMLTDYVSLYWRDGDLAGKAERRPLSAASKRGLREAFAHFDAFQLGRYRGEDKEVKLVDVMRLVRPRPTASQQEAFRALRAGTLRTPDTWERALSNLGPGETKADAWTRLLSEDKVGGLALLRNLRNIEEAKVEPAVVRAALGRLRGRYLLPLNFWAAWKAAPRWAAEIEDAMLRTYETLPKLPGVTAFVLDGSGSMSSRLSAASELQRFDAGVALLTLAASQAETAVLYVTSGSDGRRVHATERLPGLRGFALAQVARETASRLGGGGIFTRQAVEWVKADMREAADRLIVFSDSQDCDRPDTPPAQPFGRANYLIDVGGHAFGVNYAGTWTAEVSGWSQAFLTYIAAMEGLNVAGMTEPAGDDQGTVEA